MKRSLSVLTKLIRYFCILAMLIITVVVFIQVINRYFFGKSFQWAEELSILLMIWVAFLGSVLAIRSDSHSRIDFLVKKLPERIKKIVDVFNYLVCALFAAFLAYYSLDIVKAKMDIISTGLPISTAFWPLAVTVGGGLMVVYLVIMALCRAFGWNLEEDVKS
ncbi:MAG: TRAP transporter small permease [Christensenellales bacterium]|jgi:TRAP-type C4-dicarboxylate transport system permease small subunit